MKEIIALLTIILFFSACSKKANNDEGQPDPVNNSKKYPVQINVTSFSQETGSFDGRKAGVTARTSADSLRQYVNYLLYNVYDTTALRIKTIYQTSSDSTFGVIRDSLPAGKYVISITASKDSAFKDPADYVDPIYTRDGVGLLGRIPGTDIFYKRVQINVDGAVNQPMELARVVSKLKINLKDQMPFDAGFISLEMIDSFKSSSNLPAFLDFWSGIISGGYHDLQRYPAYKVHVPDSAKGKTDFSIETYVLNSKIIPTIIVLTATDTLDRYMIRKQIPNVTLEVNRKTILSGRLFVNPGTGVNTSINTQWRQDSIYVGF